MQKVQLKVHWKVRERKAYHHWKNIRKEPGKKMQGPGKKMQVAKKRYYRDPESRRQYWKKISRKPSIRKNIYKKEVSEKS